MSRIGKLPVVLPDNVEVNIINNNINVKGPLGELSLTFNENIEVKKDENSLIVNPKSKDPLSLALWGTTRANINNMVTWVTQGYTKSLEINWVWYKFEVQWNKLILSIWYSHKVEMEAPEWITIKLDDKLKNVIHISWTDKQLVWRFASQIKHKKKPEPYKGKWIKYVWEFIRRKAWKSGK